MVQIKVKMKVEKVFKHYNFRFSEKIDRGEARYGPKPSSSSHFYP